MSEPSVTTVQLQNWVARIQAGDPAARDELLRAVCDRLERLARAMLQRYPSVRRWEETGDVFDPATAERLKTFVYAAGGSREPAEAYKAFRGRLPSPEALLRKRGLAGAETPSPAA